MIPRKVFLRAMILCLALSSFVLNSSHATGKCEDYLTKNSLEEVAARDLPEAAALGLGILPVLTADQAQDAAFMVLEQITLKPREAKQEVLSWHVRLKQRQVSGHPLSVLEHTTLVFAFRSGLLKATEVDEAATAEITATLERSWRELTGAVPSDLFGRLPRSVLRGETREIRQFHAAAFQNLPPKRAAEEVALGQDFVWEYRDFLMAAGTLALGFSHTGSQVLAGTVLGYAMASFFEYGLHGGISHGSAKFDRFMQRIGGAVEKMYREFRYSHEVIHHAKTFRTGHEVQFASEKEKQELDLLLAGMGSAGKSIVAGRYSLTLAPGGTLQAILVTLPFSVAITAVVHTVATKIGLHPNAVFDVLSVMGSWLFIPASRNFHQYAHMKREDALATARPLMRWFLTTRYAAMMSRVHFGHHRGRGGNYNFLFGADPFFGTLRKPTMRQMLEMRKRGLIY